MGFLNALSFIVSFAIKNSHSKVIALPTHTILGRPHRSNYLSAFIMIIQMVQRSTHRKQKSGTRRDRNEREKREKGFRNRKIHHGPSTISEEW